MINQKLMIKLNKEVLEHHLELMVDEFKLFESNLCSPRDDLIEDCLSDYFDFLLICNPSIYTVEF